MTYKTLISGQVLGDVSIVGKHIINRAGLFLMTGSQVALLTFNRECIKNSSAQSSESVCISLILSAHRNL